MIPGVINICGVPHQIIQCKDNFNVDSHFGEIDHIAATIKINEEMPEPLKMQTLCHEWLHGALILLGYNDESANEQFINALSNAIYQTFQLRGNTP